jgi:hypothetical protein
MKLTGKHQFSNTLARSIVKFIWVNSLFEFEELYRLTSICPNGERPASVAIAGVAPAT